MLNFCRIMDAQLATRLTTLCFQTSRCGNCDKHTAHRQLLAAGNVTLLSFIVHAAAVLTLLLYVCHQHNSVPRLASLQKLDCLVQLHTAICSKAMSMVAPTHVNSLFTTVVSCCPVHSALLSFFWPHHGTDQSRS